VILTNYVPSSARSQCFITTESKMAKHGVKFFQSISLRQCAVTLRHTRAYAGGTSRATKNRRRRRRRSRKMKTINAKNRAPGDRHSARVQLARWSRNRRAVRRNDKYRVTRVLRKRTRPKACFTFAYYYNYRMRVSWRVCVDARARSLAECVSFVSV